jgi:hypothetical protein
MKRLKAEGIARRTKLLEAMPESFSVQDLADTHGLAVYVARNQVVKMLKRAEAMEILPATRPKMYRRVKP